MDARKFLDTARILLNPAHVPPTPQAFRTAISRSYYAVYGVVCDLLDKAGIEIIEPNQGHNAAKQVLLFCSDDLSKRLGGDLKTLHGQRWSADYDMKDQLIGTYETASVGLKQAEDCIGDIDSLFRSKGSFAQMKSKLKKWVDDNPGKGLKNKS